MEPRVRLAASSSGLPLPRKPSHLRLPLAGAWISALVLGLSVAARGQGTVLLSNLVPGRVNAKIYAGDGLTGLNGPGYAAQLYYSPSSPDPSTFAPASATPTTFRTGAAAGYMTPKTVPLIGIAPGSGAWVQVRVWNASLGASYEAAAAADRTQTGVSTVLRIPSVGGAAPTGPGLNQIPQPGAALAGLDSFGLQADSQIALSRGVPEHRNAVVNATDTPNQTSCAGVVGTKRSYRVTPRQSGSISVSTLHSAFPAVLEVYLGSRIDNPETALKCSAASGDSKDTSLEFDGVAGQLYTALLSGTASGAGTAELTWELARLPATLNVAGLSVTYTGSALTPTISVGPVPLPQTLTFVALPARTAVAGAPTNAGDYEVVILAQNADYFAAQTNVFHILRAQQQVVWNVPARQFFGQAALPMPQATSFKLPILYSVAGPARWVSGALAWTGPGQVSIRAIQNENNPNLLPIPAADFQIEIMAPTISLVSPGKKPGSPFQALVHGPPGVRVVTDYRNDPSAPWRPTSTNVITDSKAVTMTESSPSATDRYRAYRARVEPAPP